MLPTRPGLDDREARRRKRERVIMIVTIFVIAILSLLEGHLYRLEAALPLSSNVLIFGLININIILIIFLLFLIIRNVAKLIFERRRGVIGSSLQTKLVVAFVSLSLIPTVLLFIVSINFLSYSIDNWFITSRHPIMPASMLARSVKILPKIAFMSKGGNPISRRS
jgi:two-component system nitrogen regulation sensor histidine kinase NtrY